MALGDPCVKVLTHRLRTAVSGHGNALGLLQTCSWPRLKQHATRSFSVPANSPSSAHSPLPSYQPPWSEAQPCPSLQSLRPLQTTFILAREEPLTIGYIQVYTGIGMGRLLGATRPHTADASFRLVLSVQRCRMRSALGRGGTAGCALVCWDGTLSTKEGRDYEAPPPSPKLHVFSSPDLPPTSYHPTWSCPAPCTPAP